MAIDLVFVVTVRPGTTLQDLAAELLTGARIGTDSADQNGNLDKPGHFAILAPSSVVVQPPVSSLPTLTEWGAIIMGLVILAVGTAFVFRPQTALAGPGIQPGFIVNVPLIVPAVFARTLAVLVAVALAGLAAKSLLWRATGWLDAAGALASTVICAYIIHLWVLAYHARRRGS